MAVYGFKDNKCKSQIPQFYGGYADVTSGNWNAVPNLATLDSLISAPALGFISVSNKGFPGKGNGNVIVFKDKHGAGRTYLYFDNETKLVYYAVDDAGLNGGASKLSDWNRMRGIASRYKKTITLNAGETGYVQIYEGTVSTDSVITYEVYSHKPSAIGVFLPAVVNVRRGSGGTGIGADVYNPHSEAITVEITVYVI